MPWSSPAGPSSVGGHGPSDPCVRNRLRAHRRQPDTATITALNDALQAWGFRIEPAAAAGDSPLPAHFQLTHGDGPVVLLSTLSSFSRSQDGRRAVFTAEDVKGGSVLFLDGRLGKWDAMSADFVPPVFVGSSLYALARTPNETAGPQRHAVLKDGEPVYSFQADFLVDSPIHGFYSTGDQWVLEYANRVVVNGQDLNALQGSARVFNHRHLAGRPFYFFEDNGRLSLSFDGNRLTSQYDDVLHHQCCEPAIANPRTSDSDVRFFARRDEQWFFVKALVPHD